MKIKIRTILFSICLVAFTTYISLDTFVISQAWDSDATQMNTSLFDDLDSSESDYTDADPDVTIEDDPYSENQTSDDDDSDITVEGNDSEKIYQDENISITINEYRTDDTTVYVADVVVSSAEYLKTAFAQDTYGKNITQTTSAMADANNAILAINGDNYGSQERGYVIRNGIVYREKAGKSDVLCVYADGTMEVVDPSAITAQELVEQGVWQAFSFGPALVEDGEIAVTTDQEVGKAKTSNPRTAIGWIDDLHYVLVVADGRTDESEGLSLYELADFMKKLGVKTAYNLDGGGSSTMVFQGEVLNNPTTSGNSIKERKVNDIVYVGY